MFFKILLAGGLLAASPAMASPFQTIYLFTAAHGDGAIPEDTPTQAPSGTLYGTTVIGGASDNGMIYTLDAQTGLETPFFSFPGGAGGAQPQAGVTAQGGYLYGTTYYGGDRGRCHHMGCGIVYRIDTATGQETILHRFGAEGDGRIPSGGKLLYLAGALYGTTEFGGTGHRGTAYRINPATGATTILHNFTGGMDGKRPQGALIQAGGMIYGTTFEGGGRGCIHACGILFSIDPATGAETILHAFSGATDAQYPFGSLATYGTTLYGASLYGGRAHHGAIFAYDLTTASEKVLTSFTATLDGAVPVGVTYDNGALYGGTLVGGSSGMGVEWRIDPVTGREKPLHQFTGGADGGLSYGAPFALNGTTYEGGNLADCGGMGCGTIFTIEAK